MTALGRKRPARHAYHICLTLLSTRGVEKVVDNVVEPFRQPRRCSLCSRCLFVRQLIDVVQKLFDPSRGTTAPRPRRLGVWRGERRRAWASLGALSLKRTKDIWAIQLRCGHRGWLLSSEAMRRANRGPDSGKDRKDIGLGFWCERPSGVDSAA